ncbi:MAG: hypothetical protein WCX78_00135 [Patescibacteria group bacterium]
MAIKIILLIFFCGYGFTSIFLPKTLRRGGLLWLSFWFGTIIIALLGIFFSLAKIPMNEAKYIIIFLSGLAWVYSLYKKKISFYFSKETALISFLTTVIIVFNLYPLVIKAGFPTTISLSNLDPISYNMVSDFFTKGTVLQGKELIPYKPYLWAVGDLVHNGFRWGSPMILSFFANVFNVRSYQIFSIILTLFFAFTYPLVYFLAKILVRSKTKYLAILIFLTYGMNSTLLYMLYNVFFAQIIFSGIFLLILVLMVSYLGEIKKTNTNFNSFDFLIALSLAALSSIYPEGISFILIPWALFLLYKLTTKERLIYLIIFGKISLLILLINPMSLGTAIIWNFKVLLNTTKTVWIGWEKIRYASPFEMMGFYNLYFSRNLPVLVNLIIGIPIIALWVAGFLKIKERIFIFFHLTIFLIFYFVYKFIFPNYYTYFKAITYSLFFYSILFSIGLEYFINLFKNKIFLTVIIIIIFILSLRSAYRTIYQLYYHPRIVDRSLVSLESLNNNKKILEPFFTADVFLGEYDLWKRLWREYLLMDKNIVTQQNINQEDINKKNISYVLAEKDFLNYLEKKLIFKNIIWQNKFYQLGEVKNEKSF